MNRHRSIVSCDARISGLWDDPPQDAEKSAAVTSAARAAARPPLDELALEAGEEGLAEGVVVSVAHRAHGGSTPRPSISSYVAVHNRWRWARTASDGDDSLFMGGNR